MQYKITTEHSPAHLALTYLPWAPVVDFQIPQFHVSIPKATQHWLDVRRMPTLSWASEIGYLNPWAPRRGEEEE